MCVRERERERRRRRRGSLSCYTPEVREKKRCLYVCMLDHPKSVLVLYTTHTHLLPDLYIG